MHLDAEFWVALGFVVFVILLGYLGVHNKLNAALDGRAKRIRDELDEAKRLREEASAVLASFQSKAAAAEQEAEAIVAQARIEAEMLAREAETRMADFIARRTKQAETKIAYAETQAATEVRAAAADVAVAIATHVFKSDPRGTGASDMAGQEITRLRTRLN